MIQFILPVLVLGVAGYEWINGRVEIYPAGLLLLAICLCRGLRGIEWAETLLASLLAGLIAWKAADAWPLLPMSIPLCAVLMMVPILFLCRNKQDRMVACALGGLIFELFFCVKEYMLFSFCVIRFGSRDGLSLSTTAIMLCLFLEWAHLDLTGTIKRAVSEAN